MSNIGKHALLVLRRKYVEKSYGICTKGISAQDIAKLCFFSLQAYALETPGLARRDAVALGMEKEFLERHEH